MTKSILSFLLLCFTLSSLRAQTTPETALQNYLSLNDNRYKWELRDSFPLGDGDVTAYNMLLTSQQWHEYVWTHEITILVPKDNQHDGALLFISGGSNNKGVPNWNKKDDAFTLELSKMAVKNKAIVVLLKQTPNQPLYRDLKEDALISYTFHKFKEDGDYTWPLLFPMVKSAVRAMDAVQEFSKTTLKHEINRFVVSGASKRGWTTWLTGASDKRVVAIAPMVIDILNMPVNLDYQIKMWKEYSVEIEDYVKLGIPQNSRTESGQAITTMVDPYSYRKKLTMPKMLFMGTNDQYWTVDAVKNYIDSIPGTNYICYTPNQGHDLGDKKIALASLSYFFGATMENKPYTTSTPEIKYDKKGITLKVKTTPDVLVDAIIWSTSSKDTDFRDDKWESKSLGLKKKSPVVTYTQPYPTAGFQAFYLDLKYKDANGGDYTVSTRIYVADDDEVFVK